MQKGHKAELIFILFERRSVNTKPKYRGSSAILGFPRLSPLSLVGVIELMWRLGYGLEGPVFESPQGKEIFVFS
jgi:hypothetical protein